ncbi:hypothetical protein MNBD_GAMMA25-2086 [hydrothermal vent metagenome]|uniref:Zinc ribbon-containing protein n=1 Tax=hydrothermal vent metagenome TaxID=652676 RepID=A0A3B1BBT8_9ZZZZ
MTGNNQEKLVHAYNVMLGRVKEGLKEVEEHTLPPIKDLLNKATETASELGELSREEAEKVGDYLKRDLHEAGEYLSDNGRQLKEWLKFDLEFAEVKLAELFASVADRTRIELDALADQARRVGIWHTGEVTGIGILICRECGEKLHFEKTGRIPPCPKCHSTSFKKSFGNEDKGNND